MTGEYLKDFLSTIAFLIPLCALVWKGARLSAKIDQIEGIMNEKIAKFCADHKEMQAKIESERKDTDRDINAILSTLTDIQKSIVRIETTLHISEK